MRKGLRDVSPEKILDMPTLGLDDSFEFNCKACGKCCKNREDIIFTAYDVFRLAKFFGRTPDEIIERYCEIYEGRNSHFPIVRLLPVPPENACPFLRNKKCSVHPMKPAVCRLYPLARLFVGDEGAARYVYSGANCKHEPKKITVREWIGDVASDEAEQAGILWSDMLATLHPWIQPDKTKSDESSEMLLQVLFVGAYINYNMQKPFVPQLRENFEKLKAVFEPESEHD